MSQASMPRLPEGFVHPPRLPGGCTLIVKNLEPAFMGIAEESSYLGVAEEAETVEAKIKNLEPNEKFIKLTRNDFTVYSGQEIRINPDYIVSIG